MNPLRVAIFRLFLPTSAWAALLVGLAVAGQADALVIETSTLENAYIEALPTELLSHGGISVVTRPDDGIENVTNPDPIFFRSPDEEDDDLRTRERSTIESVRHGARLTGIGANVGRVYDLDLESGEIAFSDGEKGAELPKGDPIVATYEVGVGGTGNIKTIFRLDPLNLVPFLIPLVDFSTEPQGNPDFRLVLSGISALDLFPTELGVVISRIQPTRVPEPATLALFGIGLAGLVLGRRSRVR